MPVAKPYRRTVRPWRDAPRMNGPLPGYVRHRGYAESPELYVKAYLLLQKDLRELFDYIEPADRNLRSYSLRLHALLGRAAMEVETNLRAILRENAYPGDGGKWTMGKDYWRVELSHRLSAYRVRIAGWRGNNFVRRPFAPWKDGVYQPLPWYQAYNEAKHDRQKSFEQATLQNTLDAVCAVLILLSSQFLTEDFLGGGEAVMAGGPVDGFDEAIGHFFRVGFPTRWPAEECYDFDWNTLKNTPEPFQNFRYR